MKKIRILIFLLVISVQSFSQAVIKVTGKVRDSTGLGLAAANVTILHATDSNLEVADITDSMGRYEIVVPDTGKYFLLYSMVGYAQQFTAPFNLIAGQTYHAPDIVLPAISSQLKTVSVTAQKPLIEVKPGKVVFNVESSINATGSNVMELLRKSPGVTVDNNDNISLRGKTGVKIYIDGKMTQLDSKDLAAYLKSINSNDVEAIEMISNPGAKYDAAGNAGVINIRLKKNKKFGTNGSASITYIEGISPKGNGGVNINYRNSKINVFGNIGGDIGNYHGYLNLNRTQLDTTYIQKSSNMDPQRSMNVKTGIDYTLNSKNTIGFLFTSNIGDDTYKSISNTNIYDNEGDFVRRLEAYNNLPGSRTNNNVNFNYRYADTAGKSLNVDADYGLFRGRGSSMQPNYFLDNNSNLLSTIINSNYAPTNIDIYTLKADWEQNLGKGKLGFGAKTAYVETANTFDFYDDINNQAIEDPTQSNSFKYTENVNAAYVNYSRQLNDKVNFQAGLRVENTASKGELTRADGIAEPDDTVVKNYTDLFPSGSVSWTVNPKNSLNLSYSRRIDRPVYQDLNPFVDKLDELTYQKGNAFLEPQYTDNIELVHTYKNSINTTLGYSFIHDFSTQVTDTLGSASYVQQRNLAAEQIMSLSIWAPVHFAKWWTCNLYGGYNYLIFQGQLDANTVKEFIPTYSANMQNTLTLGKNFSAEISGMFSGPSVWGITWHVKPQGGLDMGVQKLFWNKCATLKLSVTDIFYTQPWYASNNFSGLVINGSGGWESRTARLSFAYRFGSNKISEARSRQTGLESESSRIKSK